MNAQPKLLDQVRDRLRLKHYSLRTEESSKMGGPEVAGFLTDLAVNGRV